MAAVPERAAQPRLRGDRSMFSTSDDNAMMKQIVATHAPDGRNFSVKPLLLIVEDIFNRAAHAASSITDIAHQQQATQLAQLDALEEKTLQDGFHEMFDILSYTINKISCEMSCKCSGGGDAHATTLGIFSTVSNYTWDAKVVLALAAFAVSYGEFWLIVQLYVTNPLAKGVALLKQLPDIFERAEALKPKFDALGNLIKAMMDVAKCIVEFKELPSQYIAADTPEILIATAHIPTAVYWTIRSMVACTSQILGLIGMGNEYTSSTTEAWELSSLAHKVNNIYSHLKKQLYVCHCHIDEKRYIEAYQILIRLFESIHIDNMKILKALISARDDQMPLFEGSTKKRVSLDVLRRKNVLLLISDFDLSHEELLVLQQMYSETREHPARIESQYEVVWLPVLDNSTPWDETKQNQFQNLQSMMPWYSVYLPSMIEPAVIKYIKEIWHFKKRPLLVVLDPQGKVANPNAIHMMWIWGSLAFPFTSTREDALWKEVAWTIDLLADSVHPNILNWVADEKVICLYGGEDISWIRKFTKAAKEVAREAKIELEMLYVGKSSPKEKVRKNNEIIRAEELSHVIQDLTWIWYFWVRLESMWHSKVQHNRTIENDPIMHEIMTLLSYDGSDQGWAVLCKGKALEMAKSKGENLLKSFVDFSSWKPSATEKGFIPALIDQLRELHSPLHCTRLILPGTTGSIPDKVVCAECGRPMEKFYMYRCCTD